MKGIVLHRAARAVIRRFSKRVRAELGSALIKVQLGMPLGFPLSRPMPAVWAGAYELRFKDASGAQRVFYYTKAGLDVLVFHAFVKKTQKTPAGEIVLARQRLMEILQDE